LRKTGQTTFENATPQEIGFGDTISPATNTDSYIPQWDGANSKTLKDGLAVPAGGLAGITALNLKADTSALTDYLYKPGISGGQTAIGGTGVTDILKLQGTSGNGTLTSPAIQFLTGDNGATIAGTILNNGNWGIGTTIPNKNLDVRFNGTPSGVTNVLNLSSRMTSTGQGTGIGFNFHTTTDGSGNETEISRISSYHQAAGTSGELQFFVSAGSLLEKMRLSGDGNLGIGTTAPTAVLHLKSGSATANTAPLKFTSGTLLTAPEAGAVEFLTDAFYGTITTGAARKQFAFTDTTFPSSQISILGVGTPTYTTLANWEDIQLSSGRISGLTITAHSPADGTVDVSSGTGMIKIANTLTGAIKFFDFAGTTSVALTDNALNYIYVDYNAGTPRILATTDRTTIHDYDQFTIGRAYRQGTEADVTLSGVNIYNEYRRVHNRLVKKYGFDWASGSTVSESDTRKLAVTAGVWYVGNTEIDTDAIDTNVTGSFSTYYTSDSGSTWTKTASVTQLGNTQYNDVTAGLATMTANKYANYWVYQCPQGDLYVVYGQAQYNSLSEAQAISGPTLVPPYLNGNSRLIARITFLKSATNFTSVTSLRNTALSTVMSSLHNNLGNLGWSSSGHTGTASNLAGFDGTGAASYYPFGIANTNAVQINAADVADNDYAKFTATGLEGRSYSEVLSDIGAAAATHASQHAVGGADTVFPVDPNADKYLKWDDDPGALVWADAPAPEGTAILSTGEAGGTKYLREDGDGTCSWQTVTATDTTKATKALDNLASVAINTTLVSDTDNTDALGTAAISWSDLFLGSGSVITWSTAPSTADVTLTHSANALAFAGGTVSFDVAPTVGVAAILYSGGALGTPSSGTVTNLTGTASININGTVGATTPTTGVFTTITANTGIVPDANDGAYLGTTALGFSDLFLATGGVINWANGEVTLTGGSDTLTLDGGNLALGANSLTMTGSLAATGARVTKGWFTDIESTNIPTVGGSAILTSLTAPQFTTIELGHASDTTLARVSAGVVSIEGKNIYVAGGTDVAVADGGTGLSSFTAHNVLTGGTDGTALGNVAPGTSGNVLTSNGTDWTSAAPAGGGTTMLSYLCNAPWSDPTVLGTQALSANTTAYFGQIFIPSAITVNKASFYISAYTTEGTIDVGFYSESGDSKLFEFTSDAITGTGVKTKAIASQVIPAGWYYIGFVINAGAFTVGINQIDNNGPASLFDGEIASEPIWSGNMSVTAGTLPSTFDPTALTAAINNTLAMRLDN